MTAATAEAQPRLRLMFYPVQHDFLRDRRKFVALVGGRYAGKTYVGSWKAALLATSAEQTVGVIAAPDFPMLEFGAKRHFLQRLDEMGCRWSLNKSTNVLTIEHNGTEVRFATLENPSRIRGPSYNWGWVDELDYLTDPEIWAALKGSVRGVENPCLFATSTPKGRRIIYVEWGEADDADHTLYRASSLDNEFVDAQAYVAALGYTGRYYRQEILALFEGAEGLVYQDFDRIRHVRGVEAASWPGLIAVDVGVRNPTAVLTIRHIGETRHVEREVYRTGLGNAAILQAVRAEADRLGALLTNIVVDPSAAGLIADLLNLGYNVRKANNRIDDGLREVTTLLGHGLTIDPSCVNLIAEFESYAYPDNRLASDKPVDANNHALDALRYGLMYWTEQSEVIVTRYTNRAA